MALHLYNTLSGTIKEFQPLDPKSRPHVRLRAKCLRLRHTSNFSTFTFTTLSALHYVILCRPEIVARGAGETPDETAVAS